MADGIAVRHKLRVKQRRRVVEYATAHGIKPASRAGTACSCGLRPKCSPIAPS